MCNYSLIYKKKLITVYILETHLIKIKMIKTTQHFDYSAVLTLTKNLVYLHARVEDISVA